MAVPLFYFVVPEEKKVLQGEGYTDTHTVPLSSCTG
jgi:hypothetical protein